jgi:hypothetical protein
METENRTEANDSENIENQVITYTAPWNIFALGFSNKPQYPFRLAIGSFLPDINNEVPTPTPRLKSYSSTKPSIYRNAAVSHISTRPPN